MTLDGHAGNLILIPCQGAFFVSLEKEWHPLIPLWSSLLGESSRAVFGCLRGAFDFGRRLRSDEELTRERPTKKNLSRGEAFIVDSVDYSSYFVFFFAFYFVCTCL